MKMLNLKDYQTSLDFDKRFKLIYNLVLINKKNRAFACLLIIILQFQDLNYLSFEQKSVKTRTKQTLFRVNFMT